MEGVVGSSKKQIPGLARARTAGAPQGMPKLEFVTYYYQLVQQKNKKIGTTNITCTVPKQFALPSTIKKQCVLSSIWTKFEYILPVWMGFTSAEPG